MQHKTGSSFDKIFIKGLIKLKKKTLISALGKTLQIWRIKESHICHHSAALVIIAVALCEMEMYMEWLRN